MLHHVVHVTARYAPFVGGLELVVAALAREVARTGVPVDVLTTRKGAPGSASEERPEGVRVRRFRSVTLWGAVFSPGLLLALLRQPARSVVHAHYPHAGPAEMAWVAARVRRRPFVLHFHLDVEPSTTMGRVLPAYRRLVLRPVIRGAALVVALTPEMADQLVEAYGVARERLVVLPNGVDAAFFDTRRTSSTENAGIDRPFRLLHVGRLSSQKNLPRLMRAIEQLSDSVELVLVGDGECRRELERLAAGLDAHIRLVGEADRGQVREWIRWADLFVSSSDREGMPLALLEAMAAGLPLLCTDVPGTRELVRDAALVVPPDEDALARGIDELRGSAALRRQLGERGKSLSAAHTWPAVSERLVDYYNLHEVSR